MLRYPLSLSALLTSGLLLATPFEARAESFSNRTSLDVTTVASPNFSERKPKILVLHYTVFSLEDTLAVFTAGHVSSHYTVDRDGSIYQHVDEGAAAHHAGISFWHVSSLNQSSIGIEIVNSGYEDKCAADGSTYKVWEPFSYVQISQVAQLGLDIVQRYGIDPFDVIGHADIAPQRKEDPGLAFPWLLLARQGLGVAYDAEQGLLVHGQQTYSLCQAQSKSHDNDIASLQSQLANWGYAVPISGMIDDATKRVLLAFNTHYLHRWEDFATDETRAVLSSLIAWRDLRHAEMSQIGGPIAPQEPHVHTAPIQMQ